MRAAQRQRDAAELRARVPRVPGLRSQSDQYRQLANQYEAAAHPSEAASVVIRDYAGMSEGTSGLRRVLSKSESTLDQLDQTQASMAASSEGQATAAGQERLTRLTEVQRHLIDATMRALDYLDLANTEFRHLDDELGRRFFGTQHP